MEDFSPARVLELLPDPVLLLHNDGTLMWANVAAEQVFGWTLADLAGQSVVDLIHPDDRTNALLALGSVQETDLGSALEVRVRTHDDDFRLVEVRGRAALEVEGIDAIVLVVRDLTDRRRWEFARGDVRMFQTLLEYSTTITVLLDADGTIRSANGALPRQLGLDPLDLEGQPFHTLVVPEAAAEVRATMGIAATTPGLTTMEATLRRASGDGVPYEMAVINLLHDPVVAGMVVTAHDISELHAARERLSHLATHDPLTHLPNRLLFEDRLAHALSIAERRSTHLAVYFCDLDAFKHVNDRFGHNTGDDVLVETGRRLRRAVRDADTVARLGGDEFVVLAEDVDEEEGQVIAGRLRDALNDPVQVQGQSIRVVLSVGWAMGDGADDSRSLLARADASMYRDKLANRPDS